MSERKSGEARLGARHRPSGENSRFIGGGLAFGEYVRQTTEMLRRARSRLGTADLDKAVAGNAPFELYPSGNACAGKGRPYRRGVLLTHGLTDSPYFMRHLAGFFRTNGFRVMAILLPGHGTQPGDLLDVSRREWELAVAYGAGRLSEEADEIYLGGYSAGGALSVRHALCDARVRGLFLFSPAFAISPRAAWANLHKLYSWLVPSAKWACIAPDRDIYKYESFPKHAAVEMHALTQELASLLRTREMDIPVFTAASQDDITADVQATIGFMARAHHPSSRLVLYGADAGSMPSGIPAERLEWMNGALPEQRILGYAHTSIVLSPEDAHYGRAGDYSNALHYFPGDMEKYAVCNDRPGEVLQGEITEVNLKAGTLRRLMYNPRFAELEASMRRFIDGLP